MEDMAQLTGKLTEQKYRGSMEQVGRIIWRFSDTPLLDTVRLFDLTIFCFLTANSDMHLKNFSLLYERNRRIRLSPAYDLLATQLLLPEDREETALSVDGRKNKLTRRNFINLAKQLRLSEKQIDRAFHRMAESCFEMERILDQSFATRTHKQALRECMKARAERLFA
jgi:serine/threonine-protein kinase HipA